MNSSILAIRAISSVFARSLLKPILFIGIAIYVVLSIVIGLIAAYVSQWWWLLSIVPTVIFLIAGGLWVAARMIAIKVAPTMNEKQMVATKAFVTRIENAAEQIGTPKFVLVYKVLKDMVVRPANGQTYISSIAKEPGAMRQDFESLRALF